MLRDHIKKNVQKASKVTVWDIVRVIWASKNQWPIIPRHDKFFWEETYIKSTFALVSLDTWSLGIETRPPHHQNTKNPCWYRYICHVLIHLLLVLIQGALVLILGYAIAKSMIFSQFVSVSFISFELISVLI